jgi:hypothetical protein
VSDEITLKLPRDPEFARVARLVLGGLALRLDLTLETLDDLQLALGAVLARPAPPGSPNEIVIGMAVTEGQLELRIAPVQVGNALADDVGGDLNLGRVLAAVVDRVELDGDSLKLTKTVPTGG